MKIKMYLTPNTQKLVSLIESSYGDVFLRLSDGSLLSLKDNEKAALFIKQEADKSCGVEIYLSDEKDLHNFMYFMMGGCA